MNIVDKIRNKFKEQVIYIKTVFDNSSINELLPANFFDNELAMFLLNVANLDNSIEYNECDIIKIFFRRKCRYK